MFHEILHRKIEGFGWYIVGHRKAKQMGLKHYTVPGGVCSKGHHAPMSVEKTKCIKCLVIATRNKDPGMTNAETFEFWRRKLKLPKITNPKGCRYIYVVENMPYTTVSAAATIIGIPECLINHRSSLEAFPEYQKIPTGFKQGQLYVYYCGGKTYPSIMAVSKGENIKPAALLTKIHDPDCKDWTRRRVL